MTSAAAALPPPKLPRRRITRNAASASTSTPPAPTPMPTPSALEDAGAPVAAPATPALAGLLPVLSSAYATTTGSERNVSRTEAEAGGQADTLNAAHAARALAARALSALLGTSNVARRRDWIWIASSPLTVANTSTPLDNEPCRPRPSPCSMDGAAASARRRAHERGGAPVSTPPARKAVKATVPEPASAAVSAALRAHHVCMATAEPTSPRTEAADADTLPGRLMDRATVASTPLAELVMVGVEPELAEARMDAVAVCNAVSVGVLDGTASALIVPALLGVAEDSAVLAAVRAVWGDCDGASLMVLDGEAPPLSVHVLLGVDERAVPDTLPVAVGVVETAAPAPDALTVAVGVVETAAPAPDALTVEVGVDVTVAPLVRLTVPVPVGVCESAPTV